MIRTAGFLALFGFIGLASAEEPMKLASFRIEGAVEKSGEWTVEKIEKEFGDDIKELKYKLKDQDHKSRALKLLKFVEKAKPKSDPNRKNSEISLSLVIKATDGYIVNFSMGELLPAFGNREIYLILDLDGKPLPDSHAPISLVVPGETKGARSIHGIKKIAVVDGAKWIE